MSDRVFKMWLVYYDFFFGFFTRSFVAPESAALPEGCLDVGRLGRGPVTGNGSEKSGSLVISLIWGTLGIIINSFNKLITCQ